MQGSWVKDVNYFSQIYKNVDKIISSVILLLAIISVVMIGSTTVETNFFSRSVITQIAAYIIGVVAIIIILRYNYSIFKDISNILYAVSIILLLSVYIPGLGIEQFGSRAWINLRVISVQPSEIVKILFIFIIASYLDKNKDELYNFKNLVKAAAFAAPIIIIVLKEDLGSALVFVAIWIVMVFFAGVNMVSFAKLFSVGIFMFPVAYVFMADYQKDRIEAFLHPNNLALQGNWQVWQSKLAIGSGGFWGKGLFQGTQKSLDFIPVQTSDFIFSVIGEELGFIGGLLVIALYGVLLVRIMHIIRGALDYYGAIIASGIIGMLTFQIFENIAMTMGLMPVTGITLPFLSYGGSSIVSNMIAIGLILSIAARSKKITF